MTVEGVQLSDKTMDTAVPVAGEVSVPPLFVVAAPGSHSALAAAMIGSHPECFGAPHLNLFAGESLENVSLRFAKQKQTQFHGLLRMVSYLYAGEQSMEGVELARRWMMYRLAKTTPEIFEELRRKVAPLRLVDSSRAYANISDALPRARAAYPQAHFVRLVHEGEGKSASSFNASQRNQERFAAFFDALPAETGITVLIDDLLSKPQTALPPLCRALGLSDEASAIDRMLHPELSPFAGYGPVGANLGNDGDFLRDPIFRPKPSAGPGGNLRRG